ncbi:unnamed protein product [Lampetra fluviatilis]
MKNPLTQVRRVNAMNARESAQGVSEAASWHADYRGSAWVFVGGLPYELSEGDIICIFSQYGEVVNLNLVRDKATGKSKGFTFICYEDQRSTNLAVDNFNGIKIKGRTLRVDHVSEYRVPKDHTDTDPVTRALREHGCGPLVPTPTTTTPSETPSKTPSRTPCPAGSTGSRRDGSHEKKQKQQKKKRKKDKKLKKKDKKTRADEQEEEEQEEEEVLEIKPPSVHVKIEKSDPGYEKAAMGKRGERHGEGDRDGRRDGQGHGRSEVSNERDRQGAAERRVKMEKGSEENAALMDSPMAMGEDERRWKRGGMAEEAYGGVSVAGESGAKTHGNIILRSLHGVRRPTGESGAKTHGNILLRSLHGVRRPTGESGAKTHGNVLLRSDGVQTHRTFSTGLENDFMPQPPPGGLGSEPLVPMLPPGIA